MAGIKFWHVALTIIGLLVLISFFDGFKYKGDHIARVEFNDIIISDAYRHKMLMELAENESVKAVLVRIESPGGGANASEEIYEDLRIIAAQKPVVALMGGVAASGGYIVALGADRIFARPTTITGSIGVIFQWMSAKELVKKIGLEPHVVRSGSLKARPDFFEPPNLKTRQHIKEIVQKTFDWFIDLVALRRNIKRADVIKQAGDGRIFTGTQAKQLNLIDEIGGEGAARRWLVAQHNIPLAMPVENYKPQHPNDNWRNWLLSSAFSHLGFKGAKVPSPSATLPSGLMLLWQF